MSEPVSAETPGTRSPADRPARIGNFRTSAAQFLGALVLMLFASPFLDQFEFGQAIDTFLITLVLVAGVLAVGRSHRTLVLAVVLMLPAVAARWITRFWPDLLPPVVHNVAALVFIIFVEYQLLHFILRAPRVNSEVLCAGVSGYLLLGIIWMSAYMVVSRLCPVNLAHPELNPFTFTAGMTTPHTLSQFEAYYFSFITLTTVGYGDIMPLSNGARTLAMMEAMTGTLYIAVLISRLVALYTSQRSEDSKMKD
jgi:hypothetical protein